MDVRPTTTHGTWRLLTATIVAVALLMTLGVTSAMAASPTACRVENAKTGKTHKALQEAVDGASSGDRLTVRGVCVGTTFIDRSLAIKGGNTRNSGKPILDGDRKARVLTIKPGVKVILADLVITEGRATRIPNGGGISNKGKLTLRDVVVRNNDATRGAGIYNEGVLQTWGRSLIDGNGDIRSLGTSGVHNLGRLVLDDRTRVRSNTAVVNEGTLVMRGTSSISHTRWGRGEFSGLVNRGALTMQDSSSISDQGPVYNAGTLTMSDASSIHDNRFTDGPLSCGTGVGGGIRNTGTLVMNDASSVHDNSVVGPCQALPPPEAPGARGGGVYNAGMLTMNDASTIHDNEAESSGNGVPGQGGGLYNASGGTYVGVICGPGGNVVGNSPDDCHIESP